MRLDELLKQIGDQSFPPVEKWTPDFCGDLDMVIHRSGQWSYQGSPIGRPAMVRLFASILKREEGRYFLVTPVEKVGIRVEATPFVAVSAEFLGDTWIVTNNLGEQQPLDASHPLEINDPSGEPVMLWRRNLPARIHQNVMYQWQTRALETAQPDSQGHLWLNSGESRFLLAKLDRTEGE
ncbi:DUF1285 domain-containing protein [Saccharospirillum impatiens]|uniref:DUF1285 domain-containing protein n=1 Tax=Saccharospirillum impatiens TaxID=169438 RepID=UPI0004212656|nr:DUF1285 domain-containing protein [Saccharospirillum impatiens]